NEELKKPLKKLAWENGNVFENVKSLRDSVKEVQQKIYKVPHNKYLRSDEVDILKAYSKAMKEEELILYQKAKVKWLSVGDRNNAYFHKAIKSRQQRNRIDAVCDENGKRFEGSDVAEQFVMHFQKFLGESKEVKKINDIEILMQNKLSIEDAAFMIREVSDEEIKCAMFKIKDNKAPGPDGFSAHFFKKAWSIVGKDVCLAVKDFFVTGKIIREINSTLIALVPKMQTPQKKLSCIKMGDGNNTSLWVDNWRCIGQLNKFINYIAMYDGRLGAHLTIKDWMEQYNGSWPVEWTNRFPNMAYRELTREDDDVDWWKIVWFSQNIPKHAFIVWLTIQESHSHLFFECEYSKTFWSKVVDKVGMACNNYKLNEIAAGLSKKTNGNSIDSIIRRICFAASVYLVWQERNNRIFRDEKRNVEDLFGIFNDTVRMRLMSLKVKRSVAVTKAQTKWNVKPLQLLVPSILEFSSEDVP
nr:RNA-directed DNA polymerase, eukaryota, reverse transcriptase zinc-binding domain protein [Tanacetum cinerariifolium]